MHCSLKDSRRLKFYFLHCIGLFCAAIISQSLATEPPPNNRFMSLLRSLDAARLTDCAIPRKNPETLFYIAYKENGKCGKLDLRQAEFQRQYVIADVIVDNEVTPEYTYNGVNYDPALVSYVPSFGAGGGFDVNADGTPDLVFGWNRGYRQGVDNRVQMMALVSDGAKLYLDQEISSKLPVTTQLRRVRRLNLGPEDRELLVTVGHGSRRQGSDPMEFGYNADFSTINFIGQTPNLIQTKALLPEENWVSRTLSGNLNGNGVVSHSLAIGDIDNNGYDDVLVGDYYTPFALLKKKDGFILSEANYDSTINRRDEVYKRPLSLRLAHVDGDSSVDLIVGWDNLYPTRVYFNDGSGEFLAENSVDLSDGFYGEIGNALEIFSQDYDLDGDVDIVVLEHRSDNTGTYLQFFEQTSSRQFTDATEEFFGSPSSFPDAIEVNKSDFSWREIDIQNDGLIDFMGRSRSDQAAGRDSYSLFVNDGERFKYLKIDADSNPYSNTIGIYDFDDDGLLEIVRANRWCGSCNDISQPTQKISLEVLELGLIDLN